MYKKVNLEKENYEFKTDIILDISRVLLRVETTNHCNFKCTFCPHSEMKRDKKFIDYFTCNIVIYDPLDREFNIIDDDGKTVNQATSTKDLKLMIFNCDKADASLFNAPLTYNNLLKF